MMLEFILELDWKLFHLINSTWTAPWADSFFPFVTDLHKTPVFKFIFVPAMIALFIWLRGLKQGLVIFLFCLLSVLTADGIGNHGFKKTFERSRPGDTPGLEVNVRAPYGGYSFVSNHSANMFGFATFTAIIFPPSAVPVLGLATLIGYSRVYNGVHFPTDILGGAFIGILCAVFFAFCCKRVLKRFETIEVIGS